MEEMLYEMLDSMCEEISQLNKTLERIAKALENIDKNGIRTC